MLGVEGTAAGVPLTGMTQNSVDPVQVAPAGSSAGTFFAEFGCDRSSSMYIFGISVPLESVIVVFLVE